jgi:hypothetical protein
LSYRCSILGGVLESVRCWGEEAAKMAASATLPGSCVVAASDTELVELLRATHRAQQAIAAVQVKLVQEATVRGLPAAQGHRTMTGWLRSQLLIDRQPAQDLAKVAAALRARPGVESALIDGDIDVRQAAVIAAAVNAIPQELADAELEMSPAAAQEVSAEAESTLIKYADQFPAFELRRLGDQILSHVAPEIAELTEEAALRRAEARARRLRHFTLSPPIDGLVNVSGVLGVEDAATVHAAVQSLCRPAADDDRSQGQRRADAFVDICRLALRTGELPQSGGEPPQLAVTVRYDSLTAQLAGGVLPDGERVTPEAARRIACDALVLPFVLGGASQVLDAGRGRRLAGGALRRALAVRDGGCAFPGCDRPARWCDAHHLRSWSDGGATDLDNLVLLCRHHHRLIHDPGGGWRIALGDDRLPTFTPPPWVDPRQRTRRNLYHLRT